jgi:small subunit ribosomal protein S5
VADEADKKPQETPDQQQAPAPETPRSVPEGSTAEAPAPAAKQEREARTQDSPVVDDKRQARDRRGAGPRGRRGGDRRRGRKEEDRERGEFEDTLIPGGIFRCSATVKGGRRLSFAALVAVGNRNGKVGVGYGKAKEVPMAIQKAIKLGRKEMLEFPLVGDGTIPHEVHGRFGAARVVLVPAGPGTGIIAGATVKTVLEMGGVHNVLTKSFGTNNRKNLVKATLNALRSLRSREDVQTLRGVEIQT